MIAKRILGMVSVLFKSGYDGAAACLLIATVALLVFALAVVVTALYWLAMLGMMLLAVAAAMGIGSC